MDRNRFHRPSARHGRTQPKRSVPHYPIRRSPYAFPIASLVEEVQDAVCYLDFTRNHLYVNRPLRAFCPSMTTRRFSDFETLSRFFHDVFERNGADPVAVASLLEELFDNRFGCCPSMEPQHLQLGDRTLQLILNFTHTPRGVFILWRDETEALRFEEQKDSFLAELSHEFRSPLTAISGYTELLMYQHIEDEKTHGMLSLVKQEAERLERLVDNFLDYQRVNYSADLLTLSTFALKPVLEGIVAHYETTSPNHQVILSTCDVTIEADQEKLLQLLHNLIGNAIKYSPTGGTIHITGSMDDTALVLSVRDSGIGIPSEAIPYIFDEYYRVNSDSHRPIKGTGLGLRICKRIAEAHGWGIHADSVYGEGTTFSLHLYNVHR